MSWLYKGQPLTEDDIPKKAIGFIYIIKQKSTGRKYVGRKLLTKAATKTVKGVKKKTRAESDWKTYWSSSPKIKELVKELGEDDFTREILIFVSSKGMAVYAEEAALYILGALEDDNWFNDNIRAKVYRNWVKINEALELRVALSKYI